MKPPEETGAPAPDTAELDSLKRPFDPTKFKPEKDTLGRWKNLNAGRRKAATDTQAPASSEAEKINTPATPAAPAPSFKDIEEAAGAPTPEPGAEPSAAEAPKQDATLSPDAGGNLLAKALYKVVGTATGDHKAAAATGAEHKAIAGTFGAYLGFRGIALVGSLALGATVLAYLLDDARGDSVAAMFKRFFGKKPRPGDNAKPAEPTAEPVTVHAVEPARAVEVVAPAASSVGDRF